jgi:predicted ester cyclase
MSTEENKALIRRLFEELNAVKGDINRLYNGAWDEICAPDFVIHYPSEDMNLKEFLDYNAILLAAFPDSDFTVEAYVAEGDKVATRYIMQGTHKKEYRGVAPTGKRITVKGISIDRIAGGRVVETWDFPDFLGAMQQLGVIPKQ